MTAENNRPGIKSTDGSAGPAAHQSAFMVLQHLDHLDPSRWADVKAYLMKYIASASDKEVRTLCSSWPTPARPHLSHLMHLRRCISFASWRVQSSASSVLVNAARTIPWRLLSPIFPDLCSALPSMLSGSYPAGYVAARQ
eukprot:gene6345-6142_t